MPLVGFICPDNGRICVSDCLKEGGCRMKDRCATRSYLRLASSQRPWTGKPSTTQLIAGTMCSFLKIVTDYYVSPDQRAFMIHGTKGHANLESQEDEYSLLEEKFDGIDTDETGIADVLEVEKGLSTLVDYKTSGSYKVAKALGMVVIEEPIPGQFFKQGPRKGLQKTKKVLTHDQKAVDMWEWEWQLNKYRIEFEKRGLPVDRMKIQCIVRDGNTFIARSRGVYRNVYYFNVRRIPDEEVFEYFALKRKALLKALKQGFWNLPCNEKENWGGVKCQSYCEVAEFCPLGKYLKKEKEDDMIKGLSDVRRLPRAGKIRLGVKGKTDKGVEYPKEVDFFIIDPETPSPQERESVIKEFHQKYGEQPKQIPIMIPIGNHDVVFPQFYKRYGKSTLLQCKGDGETAVCSSPEYTEGLTVLDNTEMGLPRVQCFGTECPYYKARKCSRVATLQVLLPEMSGSGVWQITTGSFNSIVNLNSCLDYVKAVVGRFHMIPLLLERREQLIQDPNGGSARKHYIMHINLNTPLVDLQRLGRIDPEKVMLELPEPKEDPAELVYDAEASVVTPQQEEINLGDKPAQTEEYPDVKKRNEYVEYCAKARALLKDDPLYFRILGEDFGVETIEDLTAADLKSLCKRLKKECDLKKNGGGNDNA